MPEHPAPELSAAEVAKIVHLFRLSHPLPHVAGQIDRIAASHAAVVAERDALRVALDLMQERDDISVDEAIAEARAALAGGPEALPH